jgi:uncharacterized protein (DUF1697 family)
MIWVVAKYLALLRGINVGGKNKVPMAELRQLFEELGCTNVRSYIQSGNMVFSATTTADQAAADLEAALPRRFDLDSAKIMTLVLGRDQLDTVVGEAPPQFGKEPDTYKYDVAFLKGAVGTDVLDQLKPHPEVDSIWARPDTVYYRRLTSRLTQSRMSRIAALPAYQHMTIRNWNTTTKLLEMMHDQA